MKSPALAGIFSLAWKILRGAEVASTNSVTVDDAADQPGSEKNRRKKEQTTLKILESFILGAPIVSMTSVDETNPTAYGILDYSSPREWRYREAPALLSFDDVAAREIHHLRGTRRNRQEHANA